MKIILAAAAALSLGVSSAHADSTGGQVPNTFFTLLPGVIAKAPAQNVATAQDGQAVHAYVTQSARGTWLFAPNQNGDGND
jgi:beta-glucosidase-like glycosyl hydrolase